MDVIGIMYQPTGVMLTDEFGMEYPEMAPMLNPAGQPYWHVNAVEAIPELEAYRIEVSGIPYRTYGPGTVFYRFTDEAEFLVNEAYFPQGVSLLSTRRAEAWEAIQAKREEVGLGGIFEEVSGKWFHSDPKSRDQQLGLARKADLLAASGGDLNAVYQVDGPVGLIDLNWKTMDGSFIPMTGQLAQNIIAAYFKAEAFAYYVAEQHRFAMLSSATPETYDYSAGWPSVFGDA